MHKKQKKWTVIEAQETKDTPICFRVSHRTVKQLERICRKNGNATKVAILESLIAWAHEGLGMRRAP